MLPYLPKKELNRLAPILAKEFQEMYEIGRGMKEFQVFQRKPSTKTYKKWEYTLGRPEETEESKKDYFEYEKAKAEHERKNSFFNFIFGKVPAYPIPPIKRLGFDLRSHAQEGWELCAFDGTNFIFKRPLLENPPHIPQKG